METPSDGHAEMAQRCRRMKDVDLIAELKFLVDREKRNLAGLLIHLAQYDLRRLCRDEGYPSLFAYCVKSLGYDENTAYRMITAGKVIMHYPAACSLVACGDLTLTAILVLSPVLTDENQERLLKAAKGKSRRDLETLVAGIAPHPGRPDFIEPYQIAPEAGMKSTGAAPAVLESTGAREWQAVIPISLNRVRIGFDAAVAVLQLLDRAKQVLSHKYPDGKIEDILRDALEFLLERKDPQRKFALKSGEPRRISETPDEMQPLEPRFLRTWKAGRYIPASVKRAVWQRDDGRCVFRFEEGNICGSKEGLEFDHVRPFAKGGRSESPRNVRLLCRMHNRMAAEIVFGMPLADSAVISAGPASA
ncbi:MAG: hypothetical protein AAB268_11175 [Elusimicrobiota bacterium]